MDFVLSMGDKCPVCVDEFNHGQRRPCPCPCCGYAACRECVQKYLLSEDDPRCMSCRKAWTRSTLERLLTRRYLLGDYWAHCVDTELRRQQSLLPGTQVVLQRRKALVKINAQIMAVEEEARRLRAEAKQLRLHKIRVQEGACNDPQGHFKCPLDGCAGYCCLGEVCGSCGRKACPQCLCEEAPGHECSEGAVETAQLVLKNSRPCPVCGLRAEKVSGCPQMWCRQCKHAWDWNTGQLQTGDVHNPHYREFRNATERARVREYLDMPCGGVPNPAEVEHVLIQLGCKPVHSRKRPRVDEQGAPQPLLHPDDKHPSRRLKDGGRLGAYLRSEELV